MLSSTKTKQIQKGMIRGAVAHRRPMSKISLGGGEVVTIAAESPRGKEYKNILKTANARVNKNIKYITLTKSKELDAKILQARLDRYEKMYGPDWYKN